MDGAKHHPQALPFLFLTEMWERFGFYVAQGLLVLYMTQYYHFTDNDSYTISGIFSGFAYISPFIGGFLADKVLGFKTSIIWGGCFLILGYTLLALSSTFLFFYPALATIILGNGLFKPNISSLLGIQYDANDTRRDAGFTIFYIGINIGVAISGFSGYVRNAFGWQVTFALAGLGMIVGVITFLTGLSRIKVMQNLPFMSPKNKIQLLICCLLAIIGISFLLKIHTLINWLFPTAGLILLIFLVILTLQQTPEYRQRLIILNTLILSSVVFWMLFWQLFTSANLFVDRLVNKNLFGIPLTTTVFYASESVFILIFGSLFAWMWQTLGRLNKNPSPVTKFILSLFLVGFFSYLLFTLGELLLSPIGLSAVTMLAPAQLIGMMMGIWFVATGFGGYFAGMIAKIASIPDTAQTTADKLAIYHEAFLDYAYLAFCVAITLLIMHFALKKLLRT